VIRRDDALKEQILRPMFGDEWPQQRMFPTPGRLGRRDSRVRRRELHRYRSRAERVVHDSIWLDGCRAPWHSRRRRHPRQWRERRCRLSAGHERAEGANGAARSPCRVASARPGRQAAPPQQLRDGCALDASCRSRRERAPADAAAASPAERPLDPQRRGAGRLPIWGDPDRGFVGRANGGGTNGGFGVYQGPIRRLALRYGIKLVNLARARPAALYRRLRLGQPVMVWVGLSEGRTRDGGRPRARRSASTSASTPSF
jgi:hypothetical protein